MEQSRTDPHSGDHAEPAPDGRHVEPPPPPQRDNGADAPPESSTPDASAPPGVPDDPDAGDDPPLWPPVEAAANAAWIRRPGDEHSGPEEPTGEQRQMNPPRLSSGAGGYSPDKLRVDQRMVDFVGDMVRSGKPVAVICHAGWMLAEADVARGRRMTSVRNIRTDLRNAGADWVDEEVVVDGNLVTSRRPDDLPAFCQALLERLK